MLARIASAGIIALTLFASANANAFFDPPYITPEQPMDGEPMVVNIHGGSCDVLVSMPEFPRITQVGNDIRIVYYSFHTDNIEFCNFDVATAHLPIDGQPAGTYSYSIARVYLNFLNQEVEETLGVVPVTVMGGSTNAQPAPALGRFSLSMLIIALGAAAWRYRTSRAFLLVAIICNDPAVSAQVTLLI